MKSYKTDGNNRVIFSKDMKLIELIDVNYQLLTVLVRLDIELPFGDVSVDEVCKRSGMSSELFLTICRLYSLADYEPDYKELTVADLLGLVKSLRASHHYYLQTLLPRIATGVEKVLELCEERQRRVLGKFYEDYAEEVRAHLEYEERVIFPYAVSVAEGRSAEKDMSAYMDNHTDICEKIDDMKSIIIKYLPEVCSIRQRCDLLFDIFALREDLAKHTLLELKVLAPLVQEAERRTQ